MTATLAHIEGDCAHLAGVDVDGRPFVARIARGGVIALGRACWEVLTDIDRAAAPPVTIDDPLPDLVGREEE